MRSTADQYQERLAGVLFCFGIPRYATYFDFSRRNTTIQGQNSYFTVVSLLSVYLLEDAVFSGFLQEYIF